MNFEQLNNMKKSPLEVCPGIISKGKTSRGERKGKKISKQVKLKFIEIAEKHGPTAAEKELGIASASYYNFKTQKQNGLLDD